MALFVFFMKGTCFLKSSMYAYFIDLNDEALYLIRVKEKEMKRVVEDSTMELWTTKHNRRRI